MDGFPSSIPPEVVRLLFVAAVKARSLKRAVRLRLVCRSWKREATEAILQSDMLGDCGRMTPDWPFWSRYLMRKLRQSPSQLSPTLEVLHQAAHRTVSFRAPGTPPDNYRRLVEDCFWRICQLPCHLGTINWRPDRFEWNHSIIVPDWNWDVVKEAMLVVAAATNDVDLVLHLLPMLPDSPDHIYYTCERENNPPLLGYPLEMAAFYGHRDVLEILMDTLESEFDLEFARRAGVTAASKNNQIETLEFCLHLEDYKGHYINTLVDVLNETTSFAIFDLVFPLCNYLLMGFKQFHWRNRSEKVKPKLQSRLLSKQFYLAARSGNLAKMKHLVQLGASSRCINYQDITRHPDFDHEVIKYKERYLHCDYHPVIDDEDLDDEDAGDEDADDEDADDEDADDEDANHQDVKAEFRNAISIAAFRGYTEVVVYLLENGAQIGTRSLEAATKHGNVESVKVLLENSTPQCLWIGSSLLDAVKGEHEEVLRLLLQSFNPISEDLRKEALDAANEGGLLSMAKILEEHE